VPIPLTFQKPLALETKPRGTGKPSIFYQALANEKELIFVRSLYHLSQAFGSISNSTITQIL
jgi:hypothetical protein